MIYKALLQTLLVGPSTLCYDCDRWEIWSNFDREKKVRSCVVTSTLHTFNGMHTRYGQPFSQMEDIGILTDASVVAAQGAEHALLRAAYSALPVSRPCHAPCGASRPPRRASRPPRRGSGSSLP
jgi:hypothetical protein